MKILIGILQGSMKMKMPPAIDFIYDVATAQHMGQRDYQEDAIISDFPMGNDYGFTVLADGMGGHASGDVASKIVVTEVFSELKLQSGGQFRAERELPEVLLNAAYSANECVERHASEYPETLGMGSTLVAPVIVRNHLYWISVGDSPLYLFRDCKLDQLNEDHSLAPQIDIMAQKGLISNDAALSHPDRNCLTSVLVGSEIARVDCPQKPVTLFDGDILLVASDGLQFLTNSKIEQVLMSNHDQTSAQIAGELLAALEQLEDPDQDNISFSVIQVSKAACDTKPAKVTMLCDNTGVSKPIFARSAGKVAAVVRDLIVQVAGRPKNNVESNGTLL